MEKIDRLGWAAGVSFVCHGARIGIRVNDPAVLKHLQQFLPPGWKPASSPTVDSLYSLIVGGPSNGSRVRRYNLLYAGAGKLARTMDLGEVFQTLESDLHFTVAVSACPKIFVHAGVVAWNGKAIVIPGRSLSGKTTLVDALVRAGANYYSDEYAVFDRWGRVHPYPKPLSVRQDDGAPPKRCSVADFGGVIGTDPLRAALVVVTHFRAAARWRPRTLSPGEALLALLNNTVLARVKPALALATLQRVVIGAAALKGQRGEAQEVVASLLSRLTTESMPTSSRE